jgi:hypothetical protein
MRWNTIFLISFFFLSCRAFKPVTAGTGSTDGGMRARAAVLSSTPEKNGKKIPPASIHNTAERSGFSINGNAPELYSPMQFKYAILMDVPVEALDNLKLFSFIDDWYGTPYHFGGNSKSGIDCSAFSANLSARCSASRFPVSLKTNMVPARTFAAMNWKKVIWYFFILPAKAFRTWAFTSAIINSFTPHSITALPSVI